MGHKRGLISRYQSFAMARCLRMGKTDVITYKYVINGVNTVQGIEHLDFSQGILCLLVHDYVPVATYVTWNPEVKKNLFFPTITRSLMILKIKGFRLFHAQLVKDMKENLCKVSHWFLQLKKLNLQMET